MAEGDGGQGVHVGDLAQEDPHSFTAGGPREEVKTHLET